LSFVTINSQSHKPLLINLVWLHTMLTTMYVLSTYLENYNHMTGISRCIVMLSLHNNRIDLTPYLCSGRFSSNSMEGKSWLLRVLDLLLSY